MPDPIAGPGDHIYPKGAAVLDRPSPIAPRPSIKLSTMPVPPARAVPDTLSWILGPPPAAWMVRRRGSLRNAETVVFLSSPSA